MPELPDVEGFRRVLAEHAVGREIRHVRVPDSGVLHGTTPGGVGRALHGRRFTEPVRHGKWLRACTTGDALLLHFGMTGELHWCGDRDPVHPHDRVRIITDGGELRYRDMRKLRGLWLLTDRTDVASITGELGPDALDASRDEVVERLAGKRATLKSALLDQTVIAGLGNLLADEILWQARLSPRLRADRLEHADLRKVHTVMRRVLRAAVPAGRVPPKRSWLTGARDRRDAVCPRCATPLRRATVAGRATVWCPSCQ